MALFQGEDLVPVTTPDGRTLTLPRSLVPASLVPPPAGVPAPVEQIGQPGAPQGFADEVSYNAGPRMPEPVTAGAQIGENGGVELPAPAPAAPTMLPSPPTQTVAGATPVEVAQSNKKYDRKQAAAAKAQAAYAASDQGKMDRAQAQVQNAYGAEYDANTEAANVQAAAEDMLGGAMEQHNAKLDGYIENKAKAAQESADEVDSKLNEVNQIREKWANFKINRESDHPIINALGMALINIGAAMNGDKSAPGLEVLWKALDRKVAGQMADLDKLGKTYDMKKDEIEQLKQKGSRRLELYNTLMAGEADRAKRHLDEIVAKSASAKTIASAKLLGAQIAERAAQAAQTGVQWGLEYNQRDRHQKAQIGLGYANLGETKRHNIQEEQLKREDQYLDYQKHLAGIKGQQDTELYKAQLKQIEEVGKRGIRGMDGEFFLTKEGRAAMAQAQQLDDQAKQLEQVNPQQAQALKDQAARLRGDARTNAVVLGHNDTEAVTLSNMIASGQSTVGLIDQIKQLASEAGRGMISRDAAQVKLQSLFGQLKPSLKEAWQLGAWDKGSSNLVAEIIGADPSSDWNAGVLGSIVARKMYESPESFTGRLDSVAEQLERAAKSRLVGVGAKFGEGESVLRRAEGIDMNTPEARASAAISKGRTPLEAEAAAEPGLGGKIRDNVYALGGIVGDPQYKVNQRDAQNSMSLKYPALGQEQEAGFDVLLQTYNAGGEKGVKAGNALVAQIANAATSRPDLAAALATTLRDTAPKLYEKARAVIPPDSEVAQRLAYSENARVAVAALDTPLLVQQVTVSRMPDGKIQDVDGFREIVRRSTEGDPQAKQALADLLRRKEPKPAAPSKVVMPATRTAPKPAQPAPDLSASGALKRSLAPAVKGIK